VPNIASKYSILNSFTYEHNFAIFDLPMKFFQICILTLCSLLSANSGWSGQSIARDWDEQILAAIRIDTPHPPVHARNLFSLSVVMYDAWAAYDDKAVGTRLGGKLRRPPAERTAKNKVKALSYAMYRALLDIFPKDQ